MSGRVVKILRNRCDARREAGHFHRSARRRGTEGHFAISFEKRATKRDFRKNWFSTAHDTTMAREF
jgi:hypothetical protein